MTGSDHTSVTNGILAALPYEEYHLLTDHSQQLQLPLRQRLYESNEPIRHVYFILDGLASIVTTMEDGTTIEVLITGREGIVGLPALQSENRAVPTEAFMQIGGSGIKVSADDLRREFSRGAKLQVLLLAHMQFALSQVSQTAACNRLHDLEERLARWLLMVADRVQSSMFPLTHEFLAQMLGTRRSSVTLAAGALQRARLIEYRRGQIRILDRKGVESVTCECYHVIKELWDVLLKN